MSTLTLPPGGVLLDETDRELLEMVAEGDPDKRIATRLGRSRTAVTTRVRQLMAQTGTQTRAHLVAVALYGQDAPEPWTDTPRQIAQRRRDLLADLAQWQAGRGHSYRDGRKPLPAHAADTTTPTGRNR